MQFEPALSVWMDKIVHNMIKKDGSLRLLLLCSLFYLLPACRASNTSSGATPFPQQPAISTNFWATASESYQTVTLRGLSENSPPSLYIRDVLAPKFLAETGINVDLRISSNVEIEQIIQQGGVGQDGLHYDFVYVEQDVIYGYLEQKKLLNLSQLLNENSQLRSPDFDLNDFTDFINAFVDPVSGDLYGLPIEAFIKVYLYRTDLFANPDYQQKFKNLYHYPLAPAITFEQYRDIAQFFTTIGRNSVGQNNAVEQNEAGETAGDLWGTSVQATTTDAASFYEFFETIAPSFGLYNWGINLDTYYATINNGGSLDSKQAVDALEFWTELLAYAPPEATESDWTDVAEMFAEGRVAQGWVYGEHVAWIAADTKRSRVVGNVGVALPPTATGVMEDALTGAGYLGYYDGAAFGIPVDSQNIQPALIWLQYLAQPAIQPQWAAQSGRVVHLSTFDDLLVRNQDRELNGYYTLMRKQGALFSGAPPIPFHVQVRDVIIPFIHATIRAELTPQEALSAAAIAVDNELIELGYIRE